MDDVRTWPLWVQPEDLSKFSRAVALAIKKHDGVFRKYNGLPYVTHVLRVATAVATHPDAKLFWILAAVMHDLKEDTDVTDAEILEIGGQEVLDVVNELTNVSKGLTHPDGRKFNRRERKKADWDRLSKVSRPAKIIKMFDRIDNLMDMTGADVSFKRMYIEESKELLTVVGKADPSVARQLASAIEFHYTWRRITPTELATKEEGTVFEATDGDCRMAVVDGVKVLHYKDGRLVPLNEVKFFLRETGALVK